MHYVGVDYQKKYSCTGVKDEQGIKVRKGVLNNTKEEFQRFLAPYPSGKAALEATSNWGLTYDWLEEILDDVALAHLLKVKAIAEARINTERRAK